MNIHVLDDFLQLALASIDDDAAIWTLEVVQYLLTATKLGNQSLNVAL